MSYKKLTKEDCYCFFCKELKDATFEYSYRFRKIKVPVCRKHGMQLFLKSYDALRLLFK